MEEIKTKKKLNKKPLIICLALAIVFGIIGFIDIKSNAAESLNGIHFYIEIYNNNTVSQKYKCVVQGQDDMEVFYVQSHTENTNSEDTYALAYVVSKYPMTVYNYTVGVYESNMGQEYFDGSYSSVEYTINGQTFHIRQVGRYFTNTNNAGYNGYVGLTFETSLPKKELTRWYDSDEFAKMYAENNLDLKVDYDNLPIDDDMLIPENVKYNCIVNEYTSSPEEYIYDIYDVVSWDNTSEKYRIQIDSVPVVQYHKGSIKITSDIVNLGKKTTLIKEFLGNWKNEKIFDVVGNTFEKYQNGNNADMCDEIAFDFKKECDDKYTYNRFTESSILLFGYRIRYIDIENQKASAWVYLMPMEKEWNYKAYVMYSNGTTSNEKNANGLVNEYTNMEDIYDGVNDIVTENTYKDKYGSPIGDVDTSQATNWLYSVVDFIKTTPSMVGTVLAFLPQPILYGMYVTIFLGCIASAIAIVKALI